MGAAAVIVPIALMAAQQITGAASQMQTAQHNIDVYNAQAQNVDAQKAITAQQYRDKAAKLAGTANARAARSGVNITGSTAQSISQSLTQLGIDQSYEQFNLDVEKHTYLSEADYQKTLKKQAMFSALSGIPSSSASSAVDAASKYWGNSTKGTLTGYTPGMGSTGAMTSSAGYSGTLPKL